jgi:type I restriction enzyme S subunit
MARFSLVLPDSPVLRAFQRQVGVLRSRVVASIRESATLADLRDLLLPKLISGELRVPDAEKIVGRAV